MAVAEDAEEELVNINIGILGHVDSGKTTLAKALSTIGSTAAFDKNPQSQQRGITLDLGFSSFSAHSEKHGRNLQFTLVDCPGHASLIRTIIGGASIIDLMVLVIDAQKGIQIQTAECIVIGEITCDRLVVAINKVDLFPESTRTEQCDKLIKRIQKTLEQTKFKDVPICCVSAEQRIGLDDLIKVVGDLSDPEKRLKEREALISASANSKLGTDSQFVMAVDHCFSLKGSGTVLTGTVQQGRIRIGDPLELPALRIERKVKSIQSFKKARRAACAGDRCGVCVTQFDASLLERGLACSPGALRLAFGAISSFKPVRFFKLALESGAKLHVSVAHETTLARLLLFAADVNSDAEFSMDREYEYVRCVEPSQNSAAKVASDTRRYFALLEFERPLVVPASALLIGAKLDLDAAVTANAHACRIAFSGRINHLFGDEHYRDSALRSLRVFKTREKQGRVERFADDQSAICVGAFKRDSRIALFVGMRVTLSTGEIATIEGSFGQSGKFRIRCLSGFRPTTVELLKTEPINVSLRFKKYLFDNSNKIVQ